MSFPRGNVRIVTMLAASLLAGSAGAADKPEPARHTMAQHHRSHGLLDLNVKPKTTKVWIDGTFRGTCAAFDGHPQKLALLPGTHHLRLTTPDGESVEREIQVRVGSEINVGLDLRSKRPTK